MERGTMDSTAEAMSHMDDLPVTQRQCKDAHASNRQLSMWIAGACLTVCIAVSSFAGGLATSLASTNTRLDEQEKAVLVSARIQAEQRADDKRDYMTRFDRLESKMDKHLELVHKNP